MNLLQWTGLFGGASGAAPVTPTVNYDDWLQPKIDTSGTFSTDTDPDLGPDPGPLTTDIGPVFES